MPATVNQRLFDLGVSHQIGLHRRASGVVAEVVRSVNRAEAEAVALLAAIDEGSRSSLERGLAAIRRAYESHYRLVGDELASAASDLVTYEAELTRDRLQSALPARRAVRLPSAAELRAVVAERPMLGRTLAEWTSGLSTRAFGRVSDTARQAFLEGETPDAVIARVRGTAAAHRRDGQTEHTRRSVESLTRTALNGVANGARESVLLVNDWLADEVAWVSTLDSGTTPVCRGRDGKFFKVGEGPRPPAHWLCRSFVVPVVRSWRAMGLPAADLSPSQREALDGAPAERQTYGSWLRSQSAAFQDEVLGPSRGLLFRIGKYEVSRFVDPRGRTYTLDELRARDAAVFDAATRAR